MRLFLTPSLIALSSLALSQGRSSTCVWSEDFEQGIPANWVTVQVERQTQNGVGLGEFVPAFTAGTAADANGNGFFPVPDQPVSNRFAMANDDAAPCNCDLDTALLETPSIDLSGLFDIALDLRVFHTQALGGGEAWIDFSANNGEWQPLELVPAGAGWRDLTFNIAQLGGISDLRLRLRWSDNGAWASGFAIDDLCIRERLLFDLALTGARIGDRTLDPFSPANNGLGYRSLPLEQSRAMAVTVDLHNLGAARLYDVALSVLVRQNGTDHGPYSSTPIDSLVSGERASVVVPTDWVPDALGEVTFTVTGGSPTGEEDADDNQVSTIMTMTGPGWSDGYGAMAIDQGDVQGWLGSTGAFIVTNRFEILNEGSAARGMSAVLGADSQVGEFVRAIIMDRNLAFIDSSTRHQLTLSDIEAAQAGAALYLPFSTPPSLLVGDYFVGLQRLSGSGYVSIATSGNCAAGASAFMEGITFDITWLSVLPMVRLHLEDYGVGFAEPEQAAKDPMVVYPVPMCASGQVAFDLTAPAKATLTVLDGLGRPWITKDLGNLPTGRTAVDLDTRALPSGTYVVRITSANLALEHRIVVIH